MLCVSICWSVLNIFVKYTFTEMTDMHIMFGYAFGIKVAACHHNALPCYQVPDGKMFSNIAI